MPRRFVHSLWFALPALALMACASGSLTDQQKQIALDQLATSCGLQAGSLQLVGEDHVTMNIRPTDKYEAVDCMIAGTKKLPFPAKLGFVGNEIYMENKL